MNFYLKRFFKFNFAEKSVIESTLKKAITINKMIVNDISGGCGQSFHITVESPDFKGKSTIQQHRMLNEILKEQITDVHAIQYKTSFPSNDKI